MNCEYVEELLSPYLDNMLASEERALVAAHIQQCQTCSAKLTDFRRIDALLAELPRVSPRESLRERIFTSPEYLELTGTLDASRRQQPYDEDVFDAIVDKNDRPTVPHERVRRDSTRHPHLVALPGGLHSTSPSLRQQQGRGSPYRHRRKNAWGQRVMQVIIAASLLLTVGIGSFIGWSLWHEQGQMAKVVGGITPPQGPPQGGPIPAGTRFVFLRDGALWSGPSDGSTEILHLTPSSVTVAADWTVKPAYPGRVAGDMVAYIDLQQGYIHLIRSDGQSDTVIKQPLLKSGIAPSSVWDTALGSVLLNGLAWSQDGSMLAFVAAPDGAPQLYIYSSNTGEIHTVSLPSKGSAFHPVWSPDSIRIAFEFVHDGVTGILDYNTQNNGLLTIVSAVATQRNPNDTVLTLDWAANSETPTITWSTGMEGHVHAIWIRSVGVSDIGGTDSGYMGVHMLAAGDYTQAIYSRAGQYATGAWLLTKSSANAAEDVVLVDLASNMHVLVESQNIGAVQWSPDGTNISYFDALSSNVGTLHIMNIGTYTNTAIAAGVVSDPLPVWSTDGQHMLYSTGNNVFVTDMHGAKTQLKLQGSASAFAWSAGTSDEIIIAMRDKMQGLYLFETQKNALIQLSSEGASGPIAWTQIP